MVEPEVTMVEPEVTMVEPEVMMVEPEGTGSSLLFVVIDG